MRNRSLKFLAVGLCLLSLMTCAIAKEFIVPGDSNGDKIVSDKELQKANDSYKNSEITADQLGTIKTIHDSYPRKINDTRGRTITIWKPLERIIIFDHGMAEDFRSLNAQDKLIAIDDYTKQLTIYFPEISKLPSVGDTSSPNLEAILKLEPDAVIFYATGANDSCNSLQSTLESTDPNVTVIRMDGYQEPHFINEIESLGVILDKENEAKEFIDFYNSVLDPIKLKGKSLSEKEKVRVYMEGSDDHETCAQGGGFEKNFLMANGRNAFADALTQYPKVSDEDIIVRNPEIVVKIWGYTLPDVGGYNSDDVTQVKEIRDAVINRTGWCNITAVKENRVYAFYNNLIYGAQHFIGIAYLAKMFYPKDYPDLDPKAIHQEYLTRFQHLNYDLSKHGVFAYPEI
jgi:iron complex transport system substrate-binding protein